MDYHSRSHIHGSAYTIIPHRHLIEIAALVERQNTVFAICAIIQTNGKTEWTIVKYLVGCPAIWKTDVLALNDGGSAATQCWSHLIAIKTITAVYMITEFVNQFIVITTFHHKVWGVLYPHVITESILTGALQSRTIATICTSIILPCYVVHTLWIHSSVAGVYVCLGECGGDGESGSGTRGYSHIHEYLSVVG